MGDAALAAEPLAAVTFIVVAIEGHAVAVWAQGVALPIVSPTQAGEDLLVDVVVAQADGAQGVQVVVDEREDLVVSLASVGQDLTDAQTWEAAPEVLESGQSLQVVVAVGGDEGTRKGPESGQAVVDDVERFGLVAKVMLAAWDVGLTLLGRRGRLGSGLGV